MPLYPVSWISSNTWAGPAVCPSSSNSITPQETGAFATLIKVDWSLSFMRAERGPRAESGEIDPGGGGGRHPTFSDGIRSELARPLLRPALDDDLFLGIKLDGIPALTV